VVRIEIAFAFSATPLILPNAFNHVDVSSAAAEKKNF
jgi:hypothetical protein